MDMTTQQPNRRSARQTRELARRLGWLTEAQAALGWGVILVLVALLGVIYLTQASRIAAVGRRVQVLQNELIDLKRENVEFERQIAEAQSLERLQDMAVRQGFAQALTDDIEYVTVSNYPVATNEPVLAVATPEAAAVSQPITSLPEAVWVVMRQSVGDLIRGESHEQ
jgi:cell division protein FtsL